MSCEESKGYIVIGCLCLFLGVPNFRFLATPEYAKKVFKIIEPISSALNKEIEVIADPGADKIDKSKAVFGVCSRVYSGGYFIQVLNTWRETLTPAESIKYGAAALGTILAGFMQESVTKIGIINIELSTCGWIITDSQQCIKSCELN